MCYVFDCIVNEVCRSGDLSCARRLALKISCSDRTNRVENVTFGFAYCSSCENLLTYTDKLTLQVI
jgi:hypothetical protein